MTTASSAQWELRLYVAGMTPTAERAIDNINNICEEYLERQYSLEVVDLIEQPALAEDDQILAVPALVRRLPSPTRKIIGDLSNTEQVLVSMDLHGPQETIDN